MYIAATHQKHKDTKRDPTHQQTQSKQTQTLNATQRYTKITNTTSNTYCLCNLKKKQRQKQTTLTTTHIKTHQKTNTQTQTTLNRNQ